MPAYATSNHSGENVFSLRRLLRVPLIQAFSPLPFLLCGFEQFIIYDGIMTILYKVSPSLMCLSTEKCSKRAPKR